MFCLRLGKEGGGYKKGESDCFFFVIRRVVRRRIERDFTGFRLCVGVQREVVFF